MLNGVSKWKRIARCVVKTNDSLTRANDTCCRVRYGYRKAEREEQRERGREKKREIKRERNRV